MARDFDASTIGRWDPEPKTTSICSYRHTKTYSKYQRNRHTKTYSKNQRNCLQSMSELLDNPTMVPGPYLLAGFSARHSTECLQTAVVAVLSSNFGGHWMLNELSA